MRKQSWLFLLLFFIGITTVSAQKSAIYTHDLEAFNNALSLYNNGQYLSAQIIFEKVKLENKSSEVQSDCAYYSANCAIKSNQPNAEKLMERFLADYPTSIKQNQAFIEMAHYFFVQ